MSFQERVGPADAGVRSGARPFRERRQPPAYDLPAEPSERLPTRDDRLRPAIRNDYGIAPPKALEERQAEPLHGLARLLSSRTSHPACRNDERASNDLEAPRAGVHYPRSTGEVLAWFRTDADCLDYLESSR